MSAFSVSAYMCVCEIWEEGHVQTCWLTQVRNLKECVWISLSVRLRIADMSFWFTRRLPQPNSLKKDIQRENTKMFCYLLILFLFWASVAYPTNSANTLVKGLFLSYSSSISIASDHGYSSEPKVIWLQCVRQKHITSNIWNTLYNWCAVTLHVWSEYTFI